jgi:hypothetical protein
MVLAGESPADGRGSTAIDVRGSYRWIHHHCPIRLDISLAAITHLFSPSAIKFR